MLRILLFLFVNFSNIENRVVRYNGVKTGILVQDGDNEIHRQCLNKVTYNSDDLENVRKYLAQRFGKTNPEKPICKKLYVRKDIKCLENKELLELIDGLKELYRTGIYDKYSSIHANHWSQTHKSTEGMVWHRWHIRQLEKELQKVNPNISVPYWDFYNDFAAPEKSSIWNIFGTAGNQNNSFCITDGYFANTFVRYPTEHCIKREWNLDGRITPWEPPEWITSILQLSKTWSDFEGLNSLVDHLKPHLSIGGYGGDYSIKWSTNDPLFYIMHVYNTDLFTLKWQLSDDSNLVPKSYTGNKRILKCENNINRIVTSNIETDVFTYYTDTKVKEGFQIGYGDLCYIHDQLIRPINNMIKGIDQEKPIALKILMESLPRATFKRYFPKFANNITSAFVHLFPNVGNSQKKCKPIPYAKPYNSTACGLRQMKRLQFDCGMDLTEDVSHCENFYYNFMNQLQQNHYCSPYVV